MLLAHPHQAGVGQIHGPAGILLHQLPDARCFVVDSERARDLSALDHLQDGSAASRVVAQQVTRLGDHRLTGQQRRRDVAELLLGPFVEIVTSIQKRDQRSRVEEHDTHRRWPKPRMWRAPCDRSAGPSTQPTRSRH
jgi:hypothetical protein